MLEEDDSIPHFVEPLYTDFNLMIGSGTYILGLPDVEIASDDQTEEATVDSDFTIEVIMESFLESFVQVDTSTMSFTFDTSSNEDELQSILGEHTVLVILTKVESNNLRVLQDAVEENYYYFYFQIVDFS